MTHVVVNPGVCGLDADIKVEIPDGRHANIAVETQCPMISKLAEKLGDDADAYALLGMSRGGTTLEDMRKGTRIHAACPVIAGIAKTIEAAAQLALPRDAAITFIKD